MKMLIRNKSSYGLWAQITSPREIVPLRRDGNLRNIHINKCAEAEIEKEQPGVFRL